MGCRSYLPNGGAYDATVTIRRFIEKIKLPKCSWENKTNAQKRGFMFDNCWLKIDRVVLAILNHVGYCFDGFDRFLPFWTSEAGSHMTLVVHNRS